MCRFFSIVESITEGVAEKKWRIRASYMNNLLDIQIMRQDVPLLDGYNA